MNDLHNTQQGQSHKSDVLHSKKTDACPVHIGSPASCSERNRFNLTGPSQKFDPRTIAIRKDLADIALAGQFFAPHYAAPVARAAIVPKAQLYATASLDSEETGILLYGHGFALLDLTGNWAWGYRVSDHLVGYCLATTLGSVATASHRIIAEGAKILSEPDEDSTALAVLAAGSLVAGEVLGEWLKTDQGFLRLSSLVEVPNSAASPTSSAPSGIAPDS